MKPSTEKLHGLGSGGGVRRDREVAVSHPVGSAGSADRPALIASRASRTGLHPADAIDLGSTEPGLRGGCASSPRPLASATRPWLRSAELGNALTRHRWPDRTDHVNLLRNDR